MMKKDKLFIEQVKSKISKVDIVSFDIFDTLLVRPYVRPTDLFLHMEKAYERPGFSEERRDAERRTRIRHPELEDITFDMIYAEIDEEFKDMKQKEMDWEEMVLRANPELKQVYDYALAQGKKVIITSDMYLPTEFLAKVLRKNGFDNWDKLYVSGDIGKSKGKSLYYKIVDNLNVLPNKILHIGDNEHSDYNIAKLTGISPYLYTKILIQYIESNIKIKEFANNTANLLGASILLSYMAYRWQLMRCNISKSGDYWEELGYQYTGPLAYGFTRWVDKVAKERNIEELLFIARSGYVLKKVFETFNDKISSKYIYASRALKSFCLLKCDHKSEYEKFIKYFAQKDVSLANRFNAIPEKTQINFERFVIANHDLLQNIADKNFNFYQEYLLSQCNKFANIAVIDDMASRFSAQELVETVLNKKVQGFYFNVENIPEYNSFTRNSMGDYRQSISPLKYKTNDVNIWTYKWRFVEFLLGAPEYPISDIDEKGFVFSEVNENEKNRYNIAKIMCDKGVDFAKDIKKYFNEFDIFIDFDTIVKWINAYLLHPKKEDYKNVRDLTCDWKTFNSDKLDFLVKRQSFLNLLVYKSKKEMNKCINATFFWPSKYHGFLYNDDIKKNKRVIKILGIPIYSRFIKSDIQKTKFLFGLLKIRKTCNKKKTYLLGICVSTKRYQNIVPSDSQNFIHSNVVDYARISNMIGVRAERAIYTANLHKKTFKGFKNKYQGKDIVLVGAGPTVSFYKPINNVINVGLNRACLLENMHFDYLFSIDKAGLNTVEENYYNQFMGYNAIKFVGDQNLGKEFQIPESIILKYPNIRRYTTVAGGFCRDKFALNIECETLGNYATVSLQAMQFILYTNPRKVYIVGIDCTSSSQKHFIGQAYCNYIRKENLTLNDRNNIANWKKLKEFAETYYPETEIISVNPVGLKGIFRDVYTKEYLYRHPEIDEKSVEIINGENNE